MAEMKVEAILGFVILFVTLSLVLSLNSDLLTTIRDTQEDRTLSHANITLTWAGNNTAMDLTAGRITPNSERVYNNGSLIARQSNNYTVNFEGGAIIIKNQSGFGTPEWVTCCINISFDYAYGSTQRNATEFGLTTQNTIAKRLPTIALIIIIAIVIGVLLAYFLRYNMAE